MKRSLVLVVVAVLVASFFAYGCAKKKTDVAKSDLQTIHFDFDKSNIKSEYEPVLRSNATWMQNHAKEKVTIEGHCDERGSPEYNIALGDRRANSASGYMKKLGVDADRMRTVSYGEERPVCNGHDEGCWWKNRRADFLTK